MFIVLSVLVLQGRNRSQCGQHHCHAERLAEESSARLPLRGVEAHGRAKVSHSFHRNPSSDENRLGPESSFGRNLRNSEWCFKDLCSLLRSYTDEWGPKHWPPSRFNHVLKLRQAALKAARERWADYILVKVSEWFPWVCSCSTRCFTSSAFNWSHSEALKGKYRWGAPCIFNSIFMWTDRNQTKWL